MLRNLSHKIKYSLAVFLARIKETFPRIQIHIDWCVEERRNAYFFLGGGESNRKISLREPWIRWEENVEAGVKK